MKYTKELLADVAKSTISVAQVVRELGLKEAGGTHSHISKKLKEYEIDTSHFLGRAANCGDNHKGGSKKSWGQILVLRKSGRREAAFRLRRALLESGREYVCEICGQTDVWNGKPLRLEIDHKNNNWLDDRPQNLRFVCPCCHSQQSHKTNQGFTDLTSVARACRLQRLKKKDFVAE